MTVAHNLLRTNPNPDIAKLYKYVNSLSEQGNEYRALSHLEAVNIKIASKQVKPDVLNKTMTQYQLFESQNPLWAKEISINVIEFTINTYDAIKTPRQAKYFKEHFDDYCKPNIPLNERLALTSDFFSANLTSE